MSKNPQNLWGLKAERIDQISFSVSWNLSHIYATKYEIRWKIADPNNWDYTSIYDVNNPILIDNLDPNQTYVIEVLARNEEGILWGNSIIVNTEPLQKGQ